MTQFKNKTFHQKWYLIVFGFIIFLAACLRLYKLAEVPHGMTWDEAAIGYNGYAIWTTRRDEWLQKLPVSFQSFGDYKAPLAIYVNGLFTFIFGINLWAVRLPFVLSGIVAVAGMMLLVRKLGQIWQWKTKEADFYSLLAGGLLALSPWHLHFSRTGFESGIALSFTIWAVYLFLKFIHDKKYKLIFLLGSALLFVLTFYTYHSSKIVTPLLVLVIVFWFYKEILSEKIKVFWSGTFGFALLLPFIKDSLFGKGLERAGTLIFSQVDGFNAGLYLFIRQFLVHLSPSFLVMGQATTLRNGDGVWGVLLPVTFLLVLMAVFFFIKNSLKKNYIKGAHLFAFFWVTVGILPAALSMELVPHSNRAFLALPGFILLAILGLKDLLQFTQSLKLNLKIEGSHHEKNMLVVALLGILILIEGFFFIKYFNHYYTNFAKISASDFQDGYLEAFNFVKQFEIGQNEVEKIVFTSEYGQPYIFALFSRKTNPIWYRGGSLIKYEFADVNEGDLMRQNAVIVGGLKSELLLPERADKVIYGSDGQPRFKIFIKN